MKRMKDSLKLVEEIKQKVKEKSKEENTSTEENKSKTRKNKDEKLGESINWDSDST
jgi:hypothetical protein